METNVPFTIQIMSAVSAKNSANISVDLRVKYGFISNSLVLIFNIEHPGPSCLMQHLAPIQAPT